MVLNRVLSAVACLVLFGCYNGYSDKSQPIIGAGSADAGSGAGGGSADAGSGGGSADAGSGGGSADGGIAMDAMVIADAYVTDAGTCPTCSEDGTCSSTGGGGGDGGVCTTCDPYSSPPPEEEEEIADLVARAVAMEAAFHHEIDLSDNTNGCTQNLPQLPEGCIVYRGNARWLYCWMNGYTTPVGCLTACGVNAGCPLTDDQINTLVTNCGAAASSNARALCVIDGIRNAIGGGNGTGGNVCRHFARCFKRVYEAMGYNQSMTSRWFGIAPPQGHSFNLVPTTGGGQYYADSSNNILFWCP